MWHAAVDQARPTSTASVRFHGFLSEVWQALASFQGQEWPETIRVVGLRHNEWANRWKDLEAKTWAVTTGGRTQWPTEIVGQVELEVYGLRQTHNGQIELERGPGQLKPQEAEREHRPEVEELMALSEIVQLLNERFGVRIPVKEGERFVELLQQRLMEDEGLAASVRVNPRDKARLTFAHVVNDRIQDMVDISFQFYKLLNDDPVFGVFPGSDVQSLFADVPGASWGVKELLLEGDT